MKNYDAKKGFSLMELIVVLAILAALSALALPNFKGLTSDSKKTVCHTNMISVAESYAAIRTSDADTAFDDGFDENSPGSSAKNPAIYLKEAVEDNGGVVSSVSVSGTTGTYEDGDGNVCTVTFSDASGTSIKTITCAEHGDMKAN